MSINFQGGDDEECAVTVENSEKNQSLTAIKAAGKTFIFGLSTSLILKNVAQVIGLACYVL